MNYRNRDLLRLAYELECTLRIPGVCEGGRGEPCHANWAIWGKGGAMKAHDFAFASGCRACHRELDQGRGPDCKDGSDFLGAGGWRTFTWMRGHVETMRQLWGRGLIQARREGLPEKEGVVLASSHSLPPSRRKGSKRGTHTKTPDKCRIGWTRESAEGAN